MENTNPPHFATNRPGYPTDAPADAQPDQIAPEQPEMPGAVPDANAIQAMPSDAQAAEWPNGAEATPGAEPQAAWPMYPPSYPTYAGYSNDPTYAPPPASQPYQQPYAPPPSSGYPPADPGPADPGYQQQYPYANWTPSGNPPGGYPNGYQGYPNGYNGYQGGYPGYQPGPSPVAELRRHLNSAREWGQGQFQRVRAHPQSRYAALALVLLLILVVGIGIGGAFTHAATPTSAPGTIGASSAPITSIPPAAQDLQQTIIATVNAVEPSVVEVTSRGGGNGQAIGSGEILTTDGYIVTNDHVVEGFSAFSVRMSNGQTVQANLVGKDPQDDLAVLKANLSNAKPIAFADSDKVQVGSFAIALGSPLGLQDSVTFGVVSALNRTASEAPDGPAGTLTGLIQTSAPINPGNSGGALVDLQGQLIGIPTLGAVDNETGGAANGIGFAIPSNHVKQVSQQLMTNGRVTSTGQGFLGIQGQDVSPQFGPSGSGQTGVQIVGFSNDASGQSPAQSAGLHVGDVITAVDGHPVVSGDELAAALQTKQPGTKVTIQFMRGSSQQSVTVTLGERPVSAQG